MKNFKNEIIAGSLIVVIFGGVILWFVKFEPGEYLKIIIAGLIILIGIITFFWNLIKKRNALKAGTPIEDEHTDLAKVHAGSKAFFLSMYLWFIIFLFHTSFSNVEEMLGIGILGSSGLYGLCLWYYKSTSDF